MIVPVRDRAKAATTLAGIVGDVEVGDLDLGDRSSVRRFAASLVASLPRLDLLQFAAFQGHDQLWHRRSKYSLRMNWLVKEEPENYSYSQFQADKTTVWAGVKNPVAQRHLREMQKGDRVFFYHTGKEKAIVGTATVSKVAYADPKDRRASLSVVELAAGKALARPVTLAEIKADKRFADMPLVRIARLSVQPVTDAQWTMIEEMAKK